MENYKQLIKIYSENNYERMTRLPGAGYLKHPFIVPGSQSYNDSLWDWDSWLTDIAVRQIMKDKDSCDAFFLECEKGCILNFLENTGKNGCMPVVMTADVRFPNPEEDKILNIHKPCLAQHAAFIVRENDGDVVWIKDKLDVIEKYLSYYKENMYHDKTGLYFWIDDGAIGVDNDPSIFFQADKSCVSIYLNCLMYKELLAMDYLYACTGVEKNEYKTEAELLKNAINKHLWDVRNGMYYSANINLKPVVPGGNHCGCPRHWESVIQKIDSWSGFMAMWAGIVPKDRAERMVRENMQDERLFCSDYGVRTLAKTEQMYCIVKSGNPSCWLGPIWGISNYFCYRGLMNYGFVEEARELAEKTIRMFGQDLEKNGEIHEYYHPDTGEGISNPGFQNWNLLVNNMIAELDGKLVVLEF